MTVKTKILIAEHDPIDLELLENELRKGGFNYVSQIVDNGEDYGIALRDFNPDIILSDYAFPSFDGTAAFKMKQEIAPEIPFIFVTGTLGEEVSVAFIKNGVTDYVLKDKLFTLNPKIKRGLQESKERHEKSIIEQDLIKSERRFRALIENSLDMKTLATADGKLTYASPSVSKVLGYNVAEFLETPAFNLIHPDDISVIVNKMQDVLTTPGRSFFNQHRLLHKTGNWIWCEGTVTNMLHEPGINALVSNFRDISERKKTENQQEFNTNNLDALINNTNDLMWSVDKEFKLITANKAFDESVRLLSGSVVGRGNSVFTEGFLPEQLNKYKKIYERAFAGEVFTEIEYNNIPDEVWYEISYNPIRNGKEIIGAACHSRNITAIKKAENKQNITSNELQHALNDLNKIMDSSLDVICAVDAGSRFVKVSAASESVWGYKPEELIGKLLFDFVYPDDHEKTRNMAISVMEGVSSTNFENRYVCKNGTIVPMSWSVRWDAKDKVRYGIARDVTERKRLEKSIEIERQQFIDLFSEAPSSMGILTGPNHVFEMANPLYLQLIGKKEIIGKSVREVLPEVVEQGFIEILDTVYRTGKTFSAKEMLIKLDSQGNGELVDRYLDFMYQAHRGDNDRIDGILFFAIDVTEQVESRKQIEESENRFRALIEKSDEMKTLTTKNGKVLYGSPSIYKSLGYSIEEYLTKYPQDLIHPDDLQSYLDKRRNIVDTAGNSFYFMQRRRHKNGNWIWCEGTITNMLDEPGINAMVSNFSDISEKKILEQQKEFEKNNLDALLNNTSDLMWSVDKDFNLITANSAFDEMSKINFGSTVVKGSNVLSTAYTPEMHSYFKQLYERAFNGESFIETSYFDTPVEFWTEISYNPIRKGDEIIGTACHSRDITERKRTENRLAQSESRFREIFDSAPNTIVLFDINKATFVKFNDNALKMFNYSEEQLLKMGPAHISPEFQPDGRPSKDKAMEFNTRASQGERPAFDWLFLDANGKEIFCEVSLASLSNIDGPQIIGSFIDITERKKAERKIIQSEARLAESQAIGHLGNWEIDMAQNTVTWSDELFNIFGFNKNEVQPSTELFFSFIHPDDVDRLRGNVNDSLDNLKGSGSGFRFIRKDCTIRYAHIERKIELDKENNPVRLYGILQDVTEQKKAELIISESEARLAEAQALAKIGNWETDLVTMNVIWSAETFRIFELNPDSFKASHAAFMECVHPDDRLKVEESFAAALNKNLINSIEHRIVSATGHIKIVEERWRIFRNNKGIPTLAVGTCQDITERKNADLKLEQQNIELVKMNNELDHFVYSTSHDLRAPMTSIMGLIDLLQTETLSENATDLLKLMKSCLTKSDDTIKEIIDYSRNSRFEIKREKIDTEEMLADIFESIALFDLSKQIKKTLVVSKSADFYGDKLRLKIILSNIMFNAVKYSKSDTNFADIQVDVDISTVRAVIIIKDSGIGIEPELISKVFEMFYRATEFSTGSGLGLYITKECVDKIGGTINIESEVGVGTVITLNIPNGLTT